MNEKGQALIESLLILPGLVAGITVTIWILWASFLSGHISLQSQELLICTHSVKDFSVCRKQFKKSVSQWIPFDHQWEVEVKRGSLIWTSQIQLRLKMKDWRWNFTDQLHIEKISKASWLSDLGSPSP